MNNNKKPGEFLVPYPSKRDVLHKSAATWTEGKRIDDGVGNYWRIHDKIYDLTNFINKHPGGELLLDGVRFNILELLVNVRFDILSMLL